MINLSAGSIHGFMPFPDGVYLADSKLHGHGLFASKPLPPGLEFGITHVPDERFPNGLIRTAFGSFINHSFDPNCEMYEQGDTMRMRTTKDINKGEELTVDYRPWYSDEELSDYN